MAGLCTVAASTAAVAAAAAAQQHVLNFQKGVVSVVQVTIPSHNSHPHLHNQNYLHSHHQTHHHHHHHHHRRLVCQFNGSKQFLGERFSNRSSGSSRKKRVLTTCVVTTAVVEQGIESKPTPNSSSTLKPGLDTSDQSSSSSSSSDQLLTSKVSDPLVRRPSPQPRPKVSPLILDNSTNVTKKWTPRLNGSKPDDGSTVRQTFRPANKVAGSTENSEAKSPIDSLGQILEKAEKLQEQNDALSQKEKEKDRTYTKSTWRKGVGVETPPPPIPTPPTNVSQAFVPSPASNANKADTVRSNGSPPPATITRMGGPQQKQQSEVKRPELRGPPSKTPPRPLPLNQEGAQAIRKPVILRNVGARDQPGVATRPGMNQGPSSKPGTGKPTSPGANVLDAPVKPGKSGAPKGKEDWKKKSVSSSSGEGLKRRTGGKAINGDDGQTGTADARRGGRKMSKASRKAIRAEAARAAAPVKVDILEVGKEGMSVPDLAAKLAVNDAEIVKTLFMKGIATTVNQTLDEDTIKLVCEAFDVEVVEAGTLKLEDMAKKTEFLDEDDLDNLEVRPPVVTIMGHVDHGKTSLLDFIRKSKVAAGEAGGITQGIGAYSVPVIVDDQVQSCVFLDTPGHQAFTAMRARGARVTDIAIIVVAADDGVRPQTQEAIAHAKAANVPIVVAINKIDKEGAEPERVMQELSGIGLLPEDWGGDVPMVQISALNGQNVDALLETVMLMAELQELKANPNRSAKGTIIESCLDKTKGVLATLLVQNGTLKKGDVVLCGEAYGKVRALVDYTGARVDMVGPSTAVQVFGLSSVPVAGEEFEVLDSLDVARERAEECAEVTRLTRLAAQAAEGKVTLASLATSVAQGAEGGVERHQLNAILKVDVQGTLEAIREVLKVLPQDTVNLRMLMQAAGDVTISDVDLAVASDGIIIAFNVGVSSAVQSYADDKGVEIRLYKVIYELIDDIRNAMEGLLDVVQEQVPIGTAEVRAIFTSGSGKVAGCMVTDGKLVKGCGCKVIRGTNVVYTGTVSSLRRVKELAKEVVAGLECGVGIENFNEWQEGDTIEAFNLVAKKRTLEEASITTASSLAAVAAAAAPAPAPAVPSAKKSQ